MEDLEQKFKDHYFQWKMDTEHIPRKNYSYTINHPDYKEIIQMGKTALPFIFKAIKEEGKYLRWQYALESITGENHAEKDAHEDEEKNTDWLRWGQEQGIID